MPPAVVDLLCLVALLALLVVAFVHPSGRVEALVGLVAAGAVLAIGAVPFDRAVTEVRQLFPVVAFLAAILVVAEVCAAEGVFTAVGSLVARASRRRAGRMLTLTFVAAALTTAALSLDATVVLLTPVVAAAAASTSIASRPPVFACVRLANAGSLLLPVSNLTNLLAMPALGLSFLRFAALMAPVWLAVIAVEYGGHRLFFRRDLAEHPRERARVFDGHLPVFPLVVLVAMLAGFAVGSPLGVAPAWVAAAAAVVLSVHAGRRRLVTLRETWHATHVSFGVFVL